METIQHIIIDNTLKRIGEPLFSDYLCHAYCYNGNCTFERNGQAFRFEITSQQHQLMEEFMAMLERGDFRQNRDIGYYADKLCVTSKYLSEVCKKVSGLPAAFW